MSFFYFIYLLSYRPVTNSKKWAPVLNVFFFCKKTRSCDIFRSYGVPQSRYPNKCQRTPDGPSESTLAQWSCISRGSDWLCFSLGCCLSQNHFARAFPRLMFLFSSLFSLRLGWLFVWLLGELVLICHGDMGLVYSAGLLPGWPFSLFLSLLHSLSLVFPSLFSQPLLFLHVSFSSSSWHGRKSKDRPCARSYN